MIGCSEQIGFKIRLKFSNLLQFQLAEKQITWGKNVFSQSPEGAWPELIGDRGHMV